MISEALKGAKGICPQSHHLVARHALSPLPSFLMSSPQPGVFASGAPSRTSQKMYRLARNPSRRIYSCRNYSSDGVCQKCTFVYLTAVKSRIGPKIQQQLSASVEKYHQLQKELSSGNVTVAQMKELGKANAQLEPLALASEAYFEAQKVRHSEQVINAQAYEEAKQMVSQETDPDMKEMAEEEVTALVDKLEGLEEEIITLLLPQDECVSNL